jgi:nitroreductase
MSMVIAAHALGFVANWITEWYAFHPLVRERLGLKPGERIAGFIYI